METNHSRKEAQVKHEVTTEQGDTYQLKISENTDSNDLGPKVQFLADGQQWFSYYCSTLVQRDSNWGLLLDGGSTYSPEVSLSSGEMARVLDFIAVSTDPDAAWRTAR